MTAAFEKKCILPGVSNIQSVPGKGLQGTVEGCDYVIGNLRWLEGLGGDFSEFKAPLATLLGQGATLAAMAQQSPQGIKVLALMAFGDEPKTSAHRLWFLCAPWGSRC